jgi:hypothetical protein
MSRHTNAAELDNCTGFPHILHAALVSVFPAVSQEAKENNLDRSPFIRQASFFPNPCFVALNTTFKVFRY